MNHEMLHLLVRLHSSCLTSCSATQKGKPSGPPSDCPWEWCYVWKAVCIPGERHVFLSFQQMLLSQGHVLTFSNVSYFPFPMVLSELVMKRMYNDLPRGKTLAQWVCSLKSKCTLHCGNVSLCLKIKLDLKCLIWGKGRILRIEPRNCSRGSVLCIKSH